MPRAIRLTLLAVLFVFVTALECRLAWSSLKFAADPGASHDWLPLNNSKGQLKVFRAQGGLQPGDILTSVNGKPVASRADSYRAILQVPLGSRVDVGVWRNGQRISTFAMAEPRGTRLGWIGQLYVVMSNVVTPAFCLLLGFFVVYRRPQDLLAWCVLLMMAGQSQMNSFLFVVDGWPPFWSGLMRLFGGFRLLGILGWLWFGFAFPNRQSPRRLFSWLRWPLTVAILYIGGLQAIEGLASEMPSVLSWTRPLLRVIPPQAQRLILVTALLAGLGSLIFKLKDETNADSRRRLRLLIWGLLLGRGPLLALEILALVSNTNPLNDDRYFPISITVMLMLFLVPATFGYVLVVDRAMELGVVVRQGLQYAFARRSVEALRLLAAGMIVWLVGLSEDQGIGRAWRYIVLVLFALVILLMEPAARWLRGWVDRRFFREAVQAEQLLGSLSGQLRTLTEPAQVVSSLTASIRHALHVERVEAWLDGQVPAAVAARVRSGALRVDRNDSEPWLRAAQAELALPIAPRQELLGVLTLGPKRSEEPYSERDIRLLESVSHQAGLALENAQLTSAVAHEAAQRERLQRELEIAREVQTRLLPKHEPVIAGLETAGLCRPAQSIGGDYYDYLPLAGGTFALAIGDVAGKGVPAALLMSNLQAALRGLTVSTVPGVTELTGQLNRLVFDSTPSNRFITFLYSVYEPATRRWACCTAGHNPAAMIRAGGNEVVWLRTKGMGLGLKRNARFEQLELTLQPGDLILLYTDGLTEAINPAGEEFGEGRLTQSLLRHRQQPAAALRDALVRDVDAFAGDAPQHDDMTLIVMRATASGAVQQSGHVVTSEA